MKKDKKILEKITALLDAHYKSQKVEFVPGKTTIPLISPSYGKEEVVEAIESMISTWVTMGRKVRIFEESFAKYIGTKYAIMVNSGSSANLLALSVLSHPEVRKIQREDEIITPAVTWATTVYPIVNVGAKPVFIDVDADTYTLNIDSMESAISKKTSALMPVHLLGSPCNMNRLTKIAKKYDLVMIEDTCEAHGAEFNGKKVGSFGDMSTFSFFASHHITTIEGGMLLTNNRQYYELAKSMRAFGWIRDLKDKKKIIQQNKTIDSRFLFVNLGFNMRPTELQGAFGIHQIKKLDKFIRIRRENAKYWHKRFNDLKDVFILPKENSDTKHSYFCYPLTIREDSLFNRTEIVKFLGVRKIETRPIMAGNMVEQPVTKLLDHKIHKELKNSRLIMRNGFFFGNHQDVKEPQREYIADSILEFVNIKTKR